MGTESIFWAALHFARAVLWWTLRVMQIASTPPHCWFWKVRDLCDPILFSEYSKTSWLNKWRFVGAVWVKVSKVIYKKQVYVLDFSLVNRVWPIVIGRPSYGKCDQFADEFDDEAPVLDGWVDVCFRTELSQFTYFRLFAFLLMYLFFSFPLLRCSRHVESPEMEEPESRSS